ncbi:glycoside hydrolase TIM-barrel-like domain-containing protein [Methylocapsa polymorpha]|uniref:Glycoside hydrolase TIM-barrel-like domain-containing protein n=1 Tax=Methylocapsa polymorpha TaxID=3080828 RepID=A0ABZ0HL97_9HYPH|nr:glycoside hydrolase TIM-barrel-like domain-containing protein [Methylocapsa sp. RX1]
MAYILGVNLLPSTGEFTYDSVAYQGQRITEPAMLAINAYAGQPLNRTDFDLAIDQLESAFPACVTVAVVVSWFGNSTDASKCQIYPSTTYIGGSFQKWSGTAWISDMWRCSSLTQASPGLVPISSSGRSFNYGGTPSDQSIVRCIQDLKARGLRVVFYPFILMDATGFPWRGRITYAPDISADATSAVNAFLGSAAALQFTRDATNLTVSYAGSLTDFTYRRMILHYANLCVIAGGVDLFLLGSELRGLEAIRGPAWTKTGATDSAGNAIWDYPFVQGLIQLSDDVREIFDAASLNKDTGGLHNLISYAADWSAWMGCQHPGENGQWPHLDQLYAHSNVDLVCFDNYLPLSDWTTGTGGVDVLNWSDAKPSSWPPSTVAMNGLGLTGTPTIYSKDYLKANIEGGEKFNWFYRDSNNLGRGLDPNGSDLMVSLPEGDRLAQNRQPYYANQQLLANKQLRWWWNNSHQAVYDDGDGGGWQPHGLTTEWIAESKPVTFTEYGFPSCDRCANQPNVFFSAKSSESATPFWSVWDPADGGVYLPRRDQSLASLALQAIYEYWVTDGNNQISSAGVKMIEPTFMSVWNWDARPFPVFPIMENVWSDAGNWPAGNWLSGKGPFIAPPIADPPPPGGAYPAFPALAGRGWSVHYKPQFSTGSVEHASGRQSRFARMSAPIFQIAIAFDLLRMDEPYTELQALIGFVEGRLGQSSPFTFPAPVELGLGSPFLCRFADDQEDLEQFMTRLWQAQSVTLRTVKGE